MTKMSGSDTFTSFLKLLVSDSTKIRQSGTHWLCSGHAQPKNPKMGQQKSSMDTCCQAWWPELDIWEEPIPLSPPLTSICKYAYTWACVHTIKDRTKTKEPKELQCVHGRRFQQWQQGKKKLSHHSVGFREPSALLWWLVPRNKSAPVKPECGRKDPTSHQSRCTLTFLGERELPMGESENYKKEKEKLPLCFSQSPIVLSSFSLLFKWC